VFPPQEANWKPALPVSEAALKRPRPESMEVTDAEFRLISRGLTESLVPLMVRRPVEALMMGLPVRIGEALKTTFVVPVTPLTMVPAMAATVVVMEPPLAAPVTSLVRVIVGRLAAAIVFQAGAPLLTWVRNFVVAVEFTASAWIALVPFP
jgi:hypothetical protein